MAVSARLTNLQIENKDDHLATTWVLARDVSFKDIVFISEDDTVNRETITMDIPLEKGVKYYGRARPRTRQGGWGDWRNVDVFIPRTFDDASTANRIPSRIGAPRIYSVSDNKVCNRSEHPIINFILKADGYAVVGNNKHKSTSWYIEDLDRNVIWKRENIPFLICTDLSCVTDNNYVNDRHACVHVDNIVLEMNKVYRARCVFYNETNDASDISSYTFITIGEKNPALKAYLTNMLIDYRPRDLRQNITLNIPMDNFTVPDPVTDEVVVEIEIFEVAADRNNKVFSGYGTSDNPTVTITGNVLENNKVYILKYRGYTKSREATNTLVADEWEAIYFSTY